MQSFFVGVAMDSSENPLLCHPLVYSWFLELSFLARVNKNMACGPENEKNELKNDLKLIWAEGW